MRSRHLDDGGKHLAQRFLIHGDYFLLRISGEKVPGCSCCWFLRSSLSPTLVSPQYDIYAAVELLCRIVHKCNLKMLATVPTGCIERNCRITNKCQIVPSRRKASRRCPWCWTGLYWTSMNKIPPGEQLIIFIFSFDALDRRGGTLSDINLPCSC